MIPVYEGYLFEMSNVVGNKVKVVNKLPFSFYFSPKDSNHGVRIKIVFNPSRVNEGDFGFIKLCDDWGYEPGNNKHVSENILTEARNFFRHFLVLFCLSWEDKVNTEDVRDYFLGRISLHELITEMYFYEEYSNELDKITTIAELEDWCRNNNIVSIDSKAMDS